MFKKRELVSLQGQITWPTNSRREFSYVIAPLTSLLKGYESFLVYFSPLLSTFMTLSKPKNHSIFKKLQLLISLFFLSFLEKYDLGSVSLVSLGFVISQTFPIFFPFIPHYSRETCTEARKRITDIPRH